MSDKNTNCLENRACPQCQQAYMFKIVGTSVFHVHDDGVEHHEDVDYDETSRATCPSCGWEGTFGQTLEKEYLVFCRQADGTGTTYITDVHAITPLLAAEAGLKDCRYDWDIEDDDDGAPMCVGVIRAEDCVVVLWDDESGVIPEEETKNTEVTPGGH